jgi:hypothetical protein
LDAAKKNISEANSLSPIVRFKYPELLMNFSLLPEATLARDFLSSDIKISLLTKIVSSLELFSNKTLIIFDEFTSELESEENLLVEEHPKKSKPKRISENLSFEFVKKEKILWDIKIED